MAEAHKQLLVDYFFGILINRGKPGKKHLQWYTRKGRATGGASLHYLKEEKKVRKMIQRRGGGQGSEGLPDGMSCAGIFGSECTKTVVMDHHRMNGSSGSSPVHQQISEPVVKPIKFCQR